MPGDDQERFEDYLELERFIAELQAGHVVHPPQELTPTQARIYRMAILFHSATPGVSEPNSEFAARLQERLESELQNTQRECRPAHAPQKGRKSQISRRLLLTGGAAVAASAAVGAGAEYLFERATIQTQNADQVVTVKSASPMNWFAVTTLAALDGQAVQFKVENPSGLVTLTGYVVRSDGMNGDPGEKGKVIAMSAVCTHKGCIVQWSGSDRKFHCPCHGGVFTEDGGIDTGTSALAYIEPLSRLDVKIDEDGQIHVRMPASI